LAPKGQRRGSTVIAQGQRMRAANMCGSWLGKQEISLWRRCQSDRDGIKPRRFAYINKTATEMERASRVWSRCTGELEGESGPSDVLRAGPAAAVGTRVTGTSHQTLPTLPSLFLLGQKRDDYHTNWHALLWLN
jgi:hypothetical protein